MRNKGFSLIELLVVVSIMILTVGGGIVSYLRFQEKQNLLEDAGTVRSIIEEARVAVLTGNLGDDYCSYLDAYQVDAGSGDSHINLSVVCRNASQAQQSIVLKTEVLNSDTTLLHDLDMEFKALGKGVDGHGNIVLLSDNDLAYLITVSQGGAVSAGDFLPYDEAVNYPATN